MSTKNNITTEFDAAKFIAGLHLPKGTYITTDAKEGYLVVSGEASKISKARAIFQPAAAKLSLEQTAALRDMFAPKSSKTAAPAMTAWCMKCRVNVAMKNPHVVEAKTGKKMTKGECPQCGGPVFSFKVNALAPETPKPATVLTAKDKRLAAQATAKIEAAKQAAAKKNAPKSGEKVAPAREGKLETAAERKGKAKKPASSHTSSTHSNKRLEAKVGDDGRFACRTCGGVGAKITKITKIVDGGVRQDATCKCGQAMHRTLRL